MSFTSSVIYEAQRCLSNFLLQSAVARAICAKNGTIKGVMEQLATWNDLDLPFDMICFDLKIVFLITALCPETRFEHFSTLFVTVFKGMYAIFQA